MKRFNLNQQVIISIAAVTLLSLLLLGLKEVIGYYTAALILMLLVSVLAMLFEILPVLLVSVLSALIWNYFFIPPVFTFHIDKPEDVLMFVMYFVIALIHATLSSKLKTQEKKIREKEEKEKSIILYNTLLNSLSHELRTPIATIVGAVDTLQEEKNALTAENQRALLLEIEKASTRLNRQVNNLLNMSRLESGLLKIHKDWCDIQEVVTIVLQKLAHLQASNHISFLAQEPLPLFKLDFALIEEALYNLLHNAIQYTPPHTFIQIIAEHKADALYLSISDNGAGFPVAEIPYVFDKFYRLPQSKAGGTGLGLSIVKGFVEAHNGNILLENQATGGAKFTIIIPTETTYINHLKNE